MNRVFSITYYKTIQFYVSFVPVIIFILSCLDFILNGVTLKFLSIFFIGFFFIFSTIFILWCVSILIKVRIEEEYLMIYSPIFKSRISWKDITEMRYQWVSYGGYALGIKEGNKTHWVPDTFEHFEELIGVLKVKTGKAVLGG